MSGRERFLAALINKKPDRLPCQVHDWMSYYLDNFLHGISDIEAYKLFKMDPVLYRSPNYIYDPKDLANWYRRDISLGKDETGQQKWRVEVTTPDGILTQEGVNGKYTSFITKFFIEDELDFEIWDKYVPVPKKVDWSPVIEAKKLVGDTGIVRGPFWDFGQGSPWQSFSSYLKNTQDAILDCIDTPAWVHLVLNSMLEKKLKVIDRAGKFELDVVETGGGNGSTTTISPALHKEFCVPYDKIQHDAIHKAGSLVSHHLCGGIMPILDLVIENGADALETMTPKELGGDADLAEAERRIGDKICFIGGFDQTLGFEKGNKKSIYEMVEKLFYSCPNGGYICSPSDHFFLGKPENIQHFADACKSMKY